MNNPNEIKTAVTVALAVDLVVAVTKEVIGEDLAVEVNGQNFDQVPVLRTAIAAKLQQHLLINPATSHYVGGAAK